MFNKFAEVVSSVVSLVLAPRNSSLPYKSSGLPRLRGYPHGYNFLRPEKKTDLRESSSLQGLSPYPQLDPEQGDLRPDITRNLSHAVPPNPLQNGNSGSSFSKDKALPGLPSRRKKCVQLVCVLLCLLLFCCLSVVLYRGPSKFYVVLDCGSTGTRVYVYQASVSNKKNGVLPILLKSLPKDFKRKIGSKSRRAYNRMETEPGFDKLVHNISGLREAIQPLIQWAEKQIPVKSHKNTHLFLYATAGLRRLPSSDSKWLLNNAWSILKSSPFLCKREWVKIISGMEEAYYGWMALNYHTGVLGAMPVKDTFGALDLGGSSLQVTFESKEGAIDKTSLSLSIGHVNHHLRAYSLSGYGLNDAFDRSVAHLIKKLPEIANADLVSGKVEIKHPCLQSGYKEKYLCSHCASVHLEGESPSGGKEMRKQLKVPIQLVGTAKWDECSALAKVAINLSEWSDHSPAIDCKKQPCALADDQPRPLGRFYAMSGFYVVYKFFNLTPDAPLDDVLEKGREFCEKSWDTAKTSVPPQPFIEQYCFRAPYAVLLLREGLHIPDNHVTIGSGGITWTLGVALLEAGKGSSDRMEFNSYELLWEKINPVFLSVILFTSLFFFVCALSWVANWKPKFCWNPHLPLFRRSSVTSSSGFNIPSPFQFQRWSPISTANGRIKMPLSPTTARAQQRPFDTGLGFNSIGLELTDSSLYPSSTSVSHSHSSNSLGQMKFDSSNMGLLWAPHRSQTRLQSRRSQSREDLNSSLADAYLVKM